MNVNIIRIKDSKTQEWEAIFYESVIAVNVKMQQKNNLLVQIIITEKKVYEYPLSELVDIQCTDDNLRQEYIKKLKLYGGK